MNHIITTMNNKYCVIVAGGAGTRLWPLSRVSFPKQFLEVMGTEKTFLQLTYERFCTIVPPENILVVTIEKYRSIVESQLPDLPPENLLLEPYARSTAPAVAYAAYTLFKRNPEATMVVTPSDHVIEELSSYRADILSALEFASRNNVLVTLGVQPTRPDSNFGYIQAVGGRDAFRGGDPLPVKTFTEKPDIEIAKAFIETGEFLWNSGLFVWQASVIISELEKLMPQQSGWFEGWQDAIGTPKEKEFISRAYSGCEKAAIDTGVMEKTSIAWVYPAEFGWADLGAWASIYDYIPKDDSGNAVFCGDAISEDGEGNILISSDRGKLIAVSGLSDYMVIDSGDVLLVCPRNSGRYQEMLSNLAFPKYEKFR